MRGVVADNHATGPHFRDRKGMGARQYLDMKSLQDMVASLNLNNTVPVRLSNMRILEFPGLSIGS